MSDYIAILDYGMGNIHSIKKALELYFADVRYTKDASEIHGACALVLPGDGAFSAAMHQLQISGSGESLRLCLEAYRASTKPLLGICIGFQMFFENSDEFSVSDTEGNTSLHSGLAWIPGKVRRFERCSTCPELRIPHMGWNRLLFPRSTALPYLHSSDPVAYTEVDAHLSLGPYVYFIHSYHAKQVPEDHVDAYCSYGSKLFPVMASKGSIVGVQFHPEKSGFIGLDFLRCWSEFVREQSASCKSEEAQALLFREKLSSFWVNTVNQ